MSGVLAANAVLGVECKVTRRKPQQEVIATSVGEALGPKAKGPRMSGHPWHSVGAVWTRVAQLGVDTRGTAVVAVWTRVALEAFEAAL